MSGGAFHGGLRADADAFEFVHREVFPIRLRGEFDDAHVDVRERGPGAVGAGPERKASARDLAGGAAHAEGTQGDRPVGGAHGQFRVDAAHQRLARLLEGDAAQAVRAHAAHGGLSVLEGYRGFAGPATGGHDHVRGREERVQRDEVGVVGGDGHGRLIGVHRQEAALPGEGLRDGDLHAVARDGQAFHREARVGALRVRREPPFGAAVFGQAGRESAQVRPERLEVEVGLPARTVQFTFRSAGDADVRELLAEDAEARGVDVEVSGDRGASGEMLAAELHRGTSGGVVHRARESDARFAGDGSRVQDEADGTDGGRTGVLRRELHAERRKVVEERVERDAFAAEGTAKGGLQGDLAARIGGLLADDEAGPGDAGAEIGLTAGIEGVTADAEAQQRAVGQPDASRRGIRSEDERR